MKSKTIILTALAGFLLSGCAAYEKKNQSGAAVDVNGHYLYRSTLDSLTLGMSSEDSLRFVQQYVLRNSKGTDALLLNIGQRGTYKINPNSAQSQQLMLMFSDDEEEDTGKCEDKDLSLSLF